MKILIICDSFKGSLSSHEAGEAVRDGVIQVMPDADIEIMEIADGGEGMLDVFIRNAGGEKVECEVRDAVGRHIQACYVIKESTAVIESACSCGLTLISPSERNPMLTTSFGVGEMILDGLKRGCKDFIIGLGGSATNDGGVGMLQALGYGFLDTEGKETGSGGGNLGRISKIDDSRIVAGLRNIKIRIATDVRNPLTGKSGASEVFAPQKGADGVMVRELEAGMKNFAEVAARYLGRDYSRESGAGAAGGLGFALRGFLGGVFHSGIDLLLDESGFEERLSGTDLVITGEGKLDRQTFMGKVPVGILKRCRRWNIPIIAIGGIIEDGTEELFLKAGFKGIYGIKPENQSLQESMKPSTARENIKDVIIKVMGKEITELRNSEI